MSQITGALQVPGAATAGADARTLRDATDLDPLLDRIADARFVLLGEASHGTHEYYAWRTEITRRLVTERGFSFLAVEGDWPDCYAVNRCIKLADNAPSQPLDVLDGFQRWPTWMWANAEVVELANWLRDHNSTRPPAQRVGFYGLDVYSLWDSLRAIIDYLTEHEPEHVEAAMKAWRCFEPYGEDPQEYAWATRLVPTSCEDAVIAADSWGAPMQRMTVPPARGGSVEAALHEAAGGPTLFVFSPDERPSWASQTMDHRAIGVVYDPQRELAGNYVPTVLADRYDAFCFFDDSSAVRPLHLEPAAPRGEPDTFPSGR